MRTRGGKEIKLSEDLKSWRAERPSEWLMDEFIREAEEIEAKLAAAEQHAAQAQLEFAEILHNKQAEIDRLVNAERDAVRECAMAVGILASSQEGEGAEGWNTALYEANNAIRNRYPQHFKGE